MIVVLVLTAIYALLQFLIGFIPSSVLANNTFDVSSFFSLLRMGFVVFPVDLFRVCISNIVLWLTIQMGWAFVEWAYNKIPGVN